MVQGSRVQEFKVIEQRTKSCRRKTGGIWRALKKSSRQEGFSIINKKQIAYNR